MENKKIFFKIVIKSGIAILCAVGLIRLIATIM